MLNVFYAELAVMTNSVSKSDDEIELIITASGSAWLR